MSEKDRHFDFSQKKCETKQRESMKGYCGLQNQLIFSAGVVHLVPCNCANAKMVAEPSFFRENTKWPAFFDVAKHYSRTRH